MSDLRITNWRKNIDLKVLLTVLGIVAGVWLVVLLGNLVTKGQTQNLDDRILLAFRNPHDVTQPIGRPGIRSAMRDVTALGSTAILIVVGTVFAGFLFLRRDYLDIVLLAITFGGGALWNHGLKKYYARPRPSLVSHLDYVNNPSFPSGHALLSLIVYCTIGALLANLVQDRRLKIYILMVAFGLSFSVGISRMYLGVHYPSDVLAGWTIGLLWATTCWLAHHRWFKPKIPTTRPATAQRPGSANS